MELYKKVLITIGGIILILLLIIDFLYNKTTKPNRTPLEYSTTDIISGIPSTTTGLVTISLKNPSQINQKDDYVFNSINESTVIPTEIPIINQKKHEKTDTKQTVTPTKIPIRNIAQNSIINPTIKPVNQQVTPSLTDSTINSITEIHLRPDPLNLEIGSSWKVSVATTPEGLTPSFIWESSNDGVSTVDSFGLVTAVNLGEATITAYLKNSDVFSSINTIVSRKNNLIPTKTIIPTIRPTSKPTTIPTSIIINTSVPTYDVNSITEIEIRPNPLNLETGKSWKLKVAIPSNILNPTFIWKSNNANVATIDLKGLVTGKSVGEANITVTIKNTDISNTTKVIIKEPASVIISPTLTTTHIPTKTPTPSKKPTATPTNKPTTVPTKIPTPIRLNKNVDISFNPNNKGKYVPSNFLGFSTERGSLCEFMSIYKDNPVMEHLFTNLSPAVWRIGGNSVELVTWSKSDENCNNTTVNSRLVDDLFAFANKVDWKVIYGMNLKNNNLSRIKDESQYVLSKYNSSIHSLEIGNEPDLYDDWDYQTYKNKWKEYVNGIKSLSNETKIIGPSSIAQMNNQNSIRLNFFDNFIKDTKETISSTSFHLYPIGRNTLYATDTESNIDIVLSKEKTEKTKEVLDSFVSISKKHSLNTRLAETNIGGTVGISDTFTSSLWVIDYLFTALESGIKGVNFHGYFLSTRNHYSPIWSTPDKTPFATPEYYGLLLFKQAASNGYSIPLNLNTSLNVTAHAIENNNKKLQLVIINKEISKKAVVEVNTNTNYHSASAIRLTAPSLTTKITDPGNSQIELGGQPVGTDGKWIPISENISVNKNYSTIIVPPFSVILVTFAL